MLQQQAGQMRLSENCQLPCLKQTPLKDTAFSIQPLSANNRAASISTEKRLQCRSKSERSQEDAFGPRTFYREGSWRGLFQQELKRAFRLTFLHFDFKIFKRVVHKPGRQIACAFTMRNHVMRYILTCDIPVITVA